MFGLFKPKLAPDGPVTFTLPVEIEAPVDRVYALVDWDSPANAKVQLGHHVEPISGRPGEYLLVMRGMEDLRLEFGVTEAVPNRVYAFTCEIKPQIGKLLHSTERYEFEAIDARRCQVTLTTTAQFEDGMRMKDYTRELHTMAQASAQAMGKFKLHAEQGVDAVKEIEACQFG